MRILYFTPWPPDLHTGGGRHCYMNLLSLSRIPDAAIDYVGPETGAFDDPAFGRCVRKALSRPATAADKVYGAINRAATPAYGLAREFARHSTLRYDLAFIESTRCSFVLEFLDGRTRTLCSSHNVEYDYLMVNNPRKMMRRFGRRSEQRSLALADHVLVMHQAHLSRYRELYGEECCSSYSFHPVCSAAPLGSSLPWSLRNRKAVITGSLNVSYNETSIIHFLQEAWIGLSSLGFHLVIAGRAPSPKLASEVGLYENVTLIPDPPSMREILRDASLMIVPDLYGDGMKLRVAEGMSYGLPIAGTAKGLAGYDDAREYAVTAESMPELATTLGSLLVDPAKLELMSVRAYEAWRKKYSLDVFAHRVRHIVETLV